MLGKKEKTDDLNDPWSIHGGRALSGCAVRLGTFFVNPRLHGVDINFHSRL